MMSEPVLPIVTEQVWPVVMLAAWWTRSTMPTGLGHVVARQSSDLEDRPHAVASCPFFSRQSARFMSIGWKRNATTMATGGNVLR